MNNIDIRYTLLWIDDQPSTSFMDLAYEDPFRIDIHHEYCYADGIKWLNENVDICDAVILDVNCKDAAITDIPSMTVFRDNLDKVKTLCNYRRLIPWFVYTGGGYEGSESLEYAISGNSDWSKERYYHKPSQQNDLLINIIDSIKGAKEIGIRRKYSAAFSLSEEIRPDLIEVLTCLEDEEHRNAGILNKIRMIMDWVMDYCFEMGLSLVERTGSNITECSKFLDKTELSDYIPVYIQRAIHTLVRVTNEGSHRLKTKEYIENGNAPYLTRSLIYELLNVLNWLTTISTDKYDIVARQAKIQELVDKDKTEKATNTENIISDVGEIQKDGEGNLYCGKHLIQNKHIGLLGKTIKITKTETNTSRTKDKYPYFAPKFDLVD